MSRGSAARLRVCYLGNPDSAHVRRLAAAVAARGVEVAVVSYRPAEMEPPPGVEVVPLLPRASSSGSATGPHRPRWSVARMLRRSAVASRVGALAAMRRAGLKTALEYRAPDIVHAHYVSDYGFLAAATTRRPLVVSAWGSDLLVDSRHPVIATLLRWTLSRSVAVTYDSDSVAAACRRFGAGPERLHRFVFGVDQEFVRAAEANYVPPARRDPLVISNRSLARTQYNVDKLLLAVPHIQRDAPDVRVEIGNDGELRPDLEGLAKKLGVQDVVRFTGFVASPSELAAQLTRAAVFVSIPSSDGTSVSLLEAMAAGAYPVVSDIPANREWIEGDNGAVAPLSPEELARAIVVALMSPERRERAATHNRVLIAQRGAWDENVTRLIELYKSVAAAAA